jgi:oligopeptide transport system substrate-binding protein
MKRSKILMVFMALVLTLTFLATACQTGPKLAENQSIVWNMGTEPPQLNTAKTTDVVSFDIIRHVLEGLTKRDAKDNIIPGIAEKWDISTDGTVYTFHLRDAKWSNGTAVTANDFAFAYKTLLDPATAADYAYFAYPIKNAAKFNGGTATAADLGIKVIDAKTLEITLENPTGFFLDTLAFGVMMPINEAFYNEVGADNYGLEASKMIFNGAYVISNWEHEVSLTMTKNEGYYDAKAIKLTSIQGVIIKDAQAAFTSFLNGDLDIVGLADSNMVQQAKDQGFTPAQFSDGATFYLEMNLVQPELKNLKIRQAITYAINRADFCSKILKNNSQPALAFTSPAIRNWDGKGSFHATVGDLIKDNDSATAKQLYAEGLAELGVTSISLSMISDDTDRAILYANAMSQYLKANLGIDLKVESMPFKSRLERMSNKDFSVVFAGWGPDYNDPMTFLDMFETGNGNNHTSYTNPDYDAMLAEARKTVDAQARYAIYVKMEKQLMADLPIAPVYFRIRDFVTKDALKGVVRSAFQDNSFIYAYVAAQ